MKKISLIVIVCLCVCILASCSGVDFNKLNEECEAAGVYSYVGEDGSYLLVDTNPLDMDDYYDADAWEMVKTINKELGFSESLEQKMGQTRALDGIQTEEQGNVSVSWSYHPNKGLEVIYEKTK